MQRLLCPHHRRLNWLWIRPQTVVDRSEIITRT
jgi:hypothetical protein